MGRVVRQQLVAIGREAEEVVVLLEPHECRGGMIGAAAVSFFDFLLGLERLAAVAVVALIDALVDVAGVEDGLDELLAAGVMPRLARLDEFIVARCRALRQTS